MNKPQIKGLILEGIAGTGKTTTLDLLEKRKGKENISLFAENQTQRPLEYQQNATKVTHIKFLDSLLTVAKNLGKDYIFDRFHLTQLYVHHHYLAWDDFRGIENGLIELNAKICVLAVTKAYIRPRIIEDYKALGFEKLLLRYGETESEQIENYWKAQIRLMSILQYSNLPILVINTSETAPEEVADKAMSFWES